MANLAPLAGALLLGWKVGPIVILYWFECVIVGVMNLPKIALAQGGSGGMSGAVKRAVAVPFFVVHYGAFLIAGGGGALFVAVAAGGALPPVNGVPEADLRQAFEMLDRPVAGLSLAAIGLFVSHLVSFDEYLARSEYKRIDPVAQMFAPYPRLLLLLAAVLASGAVIAVMGSPVWAVGSFVIGKTLLDLRLRESRRS